MSRGRLAYWALVAVMAADYAVLVVWGGGALGAQSGGAPPLDLRATGYGFDEVRAYLTALSPEGVRLYLGPIRVLDTVFPVTCALALAIGIRHRGLGLAPALRLGLTALPLAYGAVDLAENHAVGGLMVAGAEAVTPGQVAVASALTVTKFALFGAALLALAVLLVRRRPG